MALTKVDLANTVEGVLPAANGGTGATSFPAPGTSGNVLTSNGTAWTSAAAAAFDAGTVIIFAQTTAPTGWTKLTNLDNYALRVVSGTASTGGTVAFTTAFASQTPSYTPSNGTLSVTAGTLSVTSVSGTVGSTTLSTAQIPAHSHSAPGGTGTNGCPNQPTKAYYANEFTFNTNNTGGGGSHNHSFSGSGSIGGSPSLSGTVGGSVGAINLAVQYVDVIRASKN